MVSSRIGPLAIGARLVDRTGKRLEKTGPSAGYGNPALSRDDRRLAVARVDPETGTTDIWLFELTRAVASRFTSDPASDDMPLWSPDGSRLVFRSRRNGTFGVYDKASDGSGSEAIVLDLGGYPAAAPLSWSPEGQFLVYTNDEVEPGTGRVGDLWLLPSAGDRKPVPYLRTPFQETQGQVSPDGQRLAPGHSV